MAIRAATADDLTRLRGDGQFSRIYLAVPSSPVVARGTVSAAPSSNDSVLRVSWTVTAGSHTACERDMTCLVGTTVGGYDKGVVRVRKAPTTTVLYIGETSEVSWEAGLHLTVLREFTLWARHLVVPTEDLNDILMDGDIAYTGQHQALEPIVRMGSHRVLWLTGASVATTYSASAEGHGSAVTSWLWTCPGAASITNSTTSAPTITFNSYGTYWVSATVTLANGASWKGWRMILVFDDDHPPISSLVLNSCYGHSGSGGWDFDVTLYADASLTQIPPRTPALLIAEDWWLAGSEKSYRCALAGDEAPIVAFGWLWAETHEPERLGGDVMLKFKGPHQWLKQVPAMLFGLEDTDFASNGGGVPTNWVEMQDLTPDKAMFALLHERTTFTRVCDLRLPGFTEGLAQASARGRTLWSQVQYLATELAMGRAVCDRTGTLWFERDPRFMLTTERSSLVTAMELTGDDASSLTMQRRDAHGVGYAEVSGVVFANGSSSPIGAKSPGSVPRALGGNEINLSNLALPASQAIVNERAGWAAGSESGKFNYVGVTMAQNNRILDIAPVCYVTLTLTGDYSPRDEALTGHKLFLDGMGYVYSPSGLLDTRLDLYSEGEQAPAIFMTFPGDSEPNPEEPTEPPTEPPLPPEEPPTPEPVGTGNAVVVTGSDVQSTADLSSVSPTWTTEL